MHTPHPSVATPFFSSVLVQVYRWPNGDTYEGAFAKGAMTGSGVYRFIAGRNGERDVYTGALALVPLHCSDPRSPPHCTLTHPVPRDSRTAGPTLPHAAPSPTPFTL